MLVALILAGCEPMPSSGDVFAPVAAPAPAPVAAEAVAPAPPAPAFDFDADARPEEPATPEDSAEPLTPDEVLVGLGIADLADEEPAAEPLVLVEPEPVEPEPAPVAPGWVPGTPLEGSWGVRLVSTIAEAQPPRAVLGLPDGTEAVVQPGTLLPDARLVVLAVGRDAVQIAEIIPNGDHARVETRMISALYPRQPPEP